MAITKIQSESLNLADDYAFTGTITGAGGVNTPYFYATDTGNTQSIPHATWTKVQMGNEIIDSDGAYDNTTNYRFTPQSAGKYYVFGQVAINGLDDGEFIYVAIYKNGTGVPSSSGARGSMGGNFGVEALGHAIVDMNGSTDYLEFYVNQNEGGSQTLWTGFGRFAAYKLID